ncbi:hypothetical protein FQR65_LT14877 [Abscondita terminalis]|nr:hypothetical protein FQR65_LT14877 [Abscondita terminalis]
MARAIQNQEKFIAMFRDSRCLWQTTSKDYHDRIKKGAAYPELIEKLKEVEPLANKDCVIKKINNMRSSFRKELKKNKEFIINSSEENEVSSEHTKQSNDAFYAHDLPFPKKENDTPHGRRYLTATSRSHATPPRRMTSAQQASLTDEVISVNEHFKRPRSPENRHDIFGKNGVNVLRDMLPTQRTLTKKFINDVLFHGQMDSLTSSHVLQMPLPLPQHYEGPPTVQSASPNFTAILYFAARNSYYNYNPQTIPQQEGRQPQNLSVYQQLIQFSGTPNDLPPFYNLIEGVMSQKIDRSPKKGGNNSEGIRASGEEEKEQKGIRELCKEMLREIRIIKTEQANTNKEMKETKKEINRINGKNGKKNLRKWRKE